MIAKSLLHEREPKTTKAYADMLHYVMNCDITPHTKHNELYLSAQWRVRKQYIDYATVIIDH